MAPSKYPGSAIISECGTYRSELKRFLEPYTPRPLVICGLNPSTATALDDDNTIEKEVKFAVRWGCGVLWKVNAYDYRTKDPKIMFAAEKRGIPIFTTLLACAQHGIKIEKTNMAAIIEAATTARDMDGIFLAAWGRNIELEHQRMLASLLAVLGVKVMCIKANQNGTPIHPLYQPDASDPQPWVSA